MNQGHNVHGQIIAYLIWKGSYNGLVPSLKGRIIIAYLIWKGSYNLQ